MSALAILRVPDYLNTLTVRAAKGGLDCVGWLSRRERLYAALAANSPSLLEQSGDTIAEVLARLGPEWTRELRVVCLSTWLAKIKLIKEKPFHPPAANAENYQQCRLYRKDSAHHIDESSVGVLPSVEYLLYC